MEGSEQVDFAIKDTNTKLFSEWMPKPRVGDASFMKAVLLFMLTYVQPSFLSFLMRKFPIINLINVEQNWNVHKT